MPTKYTFRASNPGSSVHVLLKPFGNSSVEGPEYSQKLTEGVEYARELALRALSRIANPDDKLYAYALRYFLIPQTQFDTYKATIESVIQSIHSGLGQEIIFKVDRVSQLGGTGGYVNFRPLSERWDFKPLTNSIQTSSHTETGDTTDILAGSIHISSWKISTPRSIAHIILHEASHRYAGTHDSGQKGYFTADGKAPRDPQDLTPELALWNADSYAWFIVKAGKQFQTVMGNLFAMNNNDD